MWAACYGASGDEDITAVVEGPDAYWIAGRFEGTVTLGGETLKSVDGGRSVFVAKVAK